MEDKKRILIVEDYEMYINIEATRLTLVGYEVDKAYNGKEAVDLYKAHEPWYYKAILMDIIMPVMDGREAAKIIRNSNREDSLCIPIISISSDNDEEAIKLSLQNGIDEFLGKPIDFPVLFNKLENLIKIYEKIHVTVDQINRVNRNKYEKLWKRLIDVNMTRTQLRQLINCSSATLAKLGKGEDVSVTTLRKICNVLNCSLTDIMVISNE